MQEIASATSNFQLFNEIMPTVRLPPSDSSITDLVPDLPTIYR